MFSIKLRHDGLTTWRDNQRAQRGAARMMPKKSLVKSLKSILDYFKIAAWLVLAIVLGVVIYNITNKVMAVINQPIAKVSILGDLGYIDQKLLQKRIEPFVSTGFLSIDLQGLHRKLEKTPWISHVEVERIWPNELKIHLAGKRPVARWGANSLLNNVGEIFVTQNTTTYQSLPLLAGPGYASEQVMQQYQIISQLLRPLDFSIASLTLSDRGSWTLVTNTGLELVLGGGDLVEKVKRFTKVYDTNLKNKIDNIARVDLRYSNGLAVAWKDTTKEMNTDNAIKMVARQ